MLSLIMKRFILYLIRWQLSSPILALCMWLMGDWNIAIATIIANLIGGCIFYFVDRRIFNDGERAGRPNRRPKNK